LKFFIQSSTTANVGHPIVTGAEFTTVGTYTLR
jgi:hypothetical protein